MNFLQKIKFECVTHSPELLLGVGIAGAVITVVTACKATLKVSEVLEEHKSDLEKIDETVANEEITEYTEEDAKKDKVIRYRDTAVQMVKLYAPAVILGVLSIGCMVKSNDILNKRNMSLAAAYTVLDNAYTRYRQNVRDKFGDEVDRQLKNSESEVEVTELKEDGTTETTKVVVADASGYSKYFTKANPDWDNNEDFILNFLRAQQTMANKRLISKGWITLNDVYKMLNFKETKAGMVVGWKYEPINNQGDNFIQFDCTKTKIINEDGLPEVVYLIDFNVDGDIYSRL